MWFYAIFYQNFIMTVYDQSHIFTRRLKNLRIILTGFLAMFVLISSISHSISLHFCGEKIQSIAIFGRAQQCEEHDNACDHQESTNHGSLDHKGCCEDATVLIDSDKYASKKTETITVASAYVFFPVAILAQAFNSFVVSAHTHFLDYRPPLIKLDITLLIQSLLI